MGSNRIQRIKISLKLVCYIFVPVILLLLPTNYFDTNTNHICLFKRFFDINCYGCGLTRALQHGIHCDFIKSIQYNKLIIIVLPMVIYIWYKETIKLTKAWIKLGLCGS